MKTFNYSKIVFYFLAVLWILLSAFKLIGVSMSYLYLGSLSFYLALENLFKLYAHFYTDYKNEKLLALGERYENHSALRWYGLYSVGFYLAIGLFLIYVGMRGAI